MKAVLYYCPGCRGRIIREVPRATQYLASHCGSAGRHVRMRKLKKQTPLP